jgi:TonB family protein
MRVRFSLGGAVLLLALSLQLRGADPVWIQVSSRNFVLYTDTTEIKGKRLLEDFEGRLAALGTALGGIPDRQFPVEVFLFSKKEDFLEAAPESGGPRGGGSEFPKAAYLWRGPDRVFVGARDRSPSEISGDIGHALGHVFFERTVIWRPFWLAEGAAEYFRKVGRSPENKRVSEKDSYPVEDLVEIVQPPKYDGEVPTPVTEPTSTIAPFRIQAHRFFRLMLAQSHASELRAYLKELGNLEGESAKLLLDVKALQSEFNGFTETLVSPGTGDFDIKTVSMTTSAMSIHRGDLLLAAMKTSDAASWYQADNAPSRAARAILARYSRSGGEPIRLLARAAMESPDAGLVQFHAGSVETKNAQDLQLQVAALDRAITLLPKLGRAHAQLARVSTLTGKGEAALPEIDKALALEPEYADQFLMIRSEALLSLNRFGESRIAAEIAANLPHLDPTIDYDRKSAEMRRRAEEARQELDGRQLQRIREEVQAIVTQREPPVPPPPPVTRPPELFGKIEYSVQSARQLSIVDAPLPIYANALIQKSATGKITVRVTIGADGKVTQASIADSQLPEMNTSTLDAAKRWTFGAAAGRPSFEARIVFTFTVQ